MRVAVGGALPQVAATAADVVAIGGSAPAADSLATDGVKFCRQHSVARIAGWGMPARGDIPGHGVRCCVVGAESQEHHQTRPRDC